MIEPRAFSAGSLAWCAYWSELAADFDVLVRCGAVQAIARDAGHDCPAGFFYTASRSYEGAGPLLSIARRALAGVAMAFEEGRAS